MWAGVRQIAIATEAKCKPAIERIQRTILKQKGYITAMLVVFQWCRGEREMSVKKVAWQATVALTGKKCTLMNVKGQQKATWWPRRVWQHTQG